MRGVINLIMGVVFVIGGASGGMVLRGTGSSAGLIIVGLILCVIGVVRMVSSAPQR